MFLSIYGIMLQIYITIVDLRDKELNSLSVLLILNFVMIIIKTIANFLIHGLVYEETAKFFSSLEDLDISTRIKDENEFKEYLCFKTQNNDSKLGFTIAGFVPYKKSTLLSVII